MQLSARECGVVENTRRILNMYIQSHTRGELTRIQQCAHFISELRKSFLEKRARVILEQQ